MILRDQACHHSDCKADKTFLCVPCGIYLCESHIQHTVAKREVIDTRDCNNRLSLVEKQQRLGELPVFSFDYCTSGKLHKEDRFDRFGTHSFSGNLPLPKLPTILCPDMLADVLMKDLQLKEIGEEFASCCPKLSSLQALAILKNKGYLGPLYSALGRCAIAKQACAEALTPTLTQMSGIYKEAKSIEVIDAGNSYTLNQRARERQQLNIDRSWAKRLYSLSDAPKSASLSPSSSSPSSSSSSSISTRLYSEPALVMCHSMLKPDWMGAMAYMTVIRKQLRESHTIRPRSIWHLTVLDFGSHYLFATNQKTPSGYGTTRIVWPIQVDESGGLTSVRTRVLDLSYGDVAHLMVYRLAPALGGDQKVAQHMLRLLEGDQSTIKKLRSTIIGVGYQRCAFLMGIITGERLQVDRHWWLSKKSRSAMNLDEYGFETNAYEALSAIMAILFIAEPRHALSMFPLHDDAAQ